MKVYDTCIFFNEQALLELKFRLLGKHVDVIVIAEGTESFTGNPHKLMAQEVIDSVYTKAEVRYIKVEYPQYLHGTWAREEFLRNSLVQGLYDFDFGDMCIYGDVDEVVNPDKLEYIKQAVRDHKFVTLCLDWLQTRASLQQFEHDKPYDFNHTRAFDRRAFADFGDKMQAMYSFYNTPRIEDCGWHFSSMGGPVSMREKLINFSHTEYSGEEYSSLEVLQKQYDLKQDIIQRPEVELRPYDITKLPLDVIKQTKNAVEYFGL